MSHQASGWAIKCSLPRTGKLVLMCLAYHADKHGANCFPGTPTLMEETGLSDRAVQQWITKLCEWGFISNLNGRNGGRGHKAEYQLHLENPEPQTPNMTTNPELETVNEVPGMQETPNLVQETPNRTTLNPELHDIALIGIEESKKSQEESVVATAAIPEWLTVLSELQQPTPEDVRRLLAWAKPHDGTILRETAYSLVQKWDWYKAQPGHKNRQPFSTFQGWVRASEKRESQQPRASPNGHKPDRSEIFRQMKEQYGQQGHGKPRDGPG